MLFQTSPDVQNSDVDGVATMTQQVFNNPVTGMIAVADGEHMDPFQVVARNGSIPYPAVSLMALLGWHWHKTPRNSKNCSQGPILKCSKCDKL